MSTAAQITLLDGGMGTALRARGVTVPDHTTSIWSALALIEAPDAVRALHRDYIRAGAGVIITNNYAVTPILLAREGLDDRLDELTVTACRLAVEARTEAGAPARVAGSLPPLDTSYRADLVGPYDEILPVYRRLAGLLAPHVDVLICETMTTAAEARAAATAAAETGLPVWVGWTLADVSEDSQSAPLRGGESLAKAVSALDDLPVEAFLLNCCSTRAVAHGLRSLASRTARPIGAYANPFRSEPPEDEQTASNPAHLDAAAYAGAADTWVSLGARIVGGCCGTDPDYIRTLARTLEAP